jgi:glucosamine--fructose-6-phosphate aminotransferase (isomerizing)
VVTSQSGSSAEIVEFMRSKYRRRCTVIGVTNNDLSPLAKSADVTITLRADAETSVSSMTYLNTLAIHSRMVAAMCGDKDRQPVEAIVSAADALASFSGVRQLAPVTRAVTRLSNPRVALIGSGDDATTALWGALTLKEAAKIPAEGFVGGEFRHGPLEIAGPGLLAVIFLDESSSASRPLVNLAVDLASAGSHVVTVGDPQVDGCVQVRLPSADPFSRLVLGARIVQAVCVELSKAQGLVPGAFQFGRKVTASR